MTYSFSVTNRLFLSVEYVLTLICYHSAWYCLSSTLPNPPFLLSSALQNLSSVIPTRTCEFCLVALKKFLLSLETVLPHLNQFFFIMSTKCLQKVKTVSNVYCKTCHWNYLKLPLV